MKKRINKVLLTLAVASTMLFTACGKQPVKTSAEAETSSEAEESKVKEEEEEKEETPPSETEEETEEISSEVEKEDTDKEELDPENRIYSTYPAFISEFTLTDGILTVTTEDAGLENYPIPKEMEFSFSYPLAEDCKWLHPYVLDEENLSDTDFMYSLLSYELEGVIFDLNSYKDGKTPYKTDEAFCTFYNAWTFTIVDGKVTEIANNGVNDATTNDETTAIVAEQNNVQVTEPTATAQPVETPTPAPVHEHSYTSSVTTSATCASTGVKTYACSCGNSYTESIPTTEHNWVPRYDTVHHESKGEMRQVQTGSTRVERCGYCDATFSSHDEFTAHRKSYLGTDNDHAVTGFLYRDEPTYDYQWVVTQEAYDEQVVVGYSCSVCGATK